MNFFPQLIRQASKKKNLDAAPLSLEKRNKAAEGGDGISDTGMVSLMQKSRKI